MDKIDLGVLKFKEGEYSPKIENGKDYDTSIFKKIYKNAFITLNEILKNSKTSEEQNNIIAFIGERGSGKTSVLKSFENILLSFKDNKDFFEKFIKNEDLKITNYDYKTIQIIDPSFFTAKSNILELVIARLFKEVKEEIKKRDCNEGNYKLEEERELLLLFKKIYKNISIIESNYDFDGENYEKLIDLSASVDLKEDIKGLIDRYLKFMSKSEKEKKLIIKIDDIDLNIRYAYEMVEQIRKYLSQENIIILMAVKLEQLEQIIKLNYKNDFKDKEACKSLDYEQMAYRYLEKLIPQERRFYLLNIEKEIKNIGIFFNGEENSENIEKALRELLYKKIRILFLENKIKNNPIIPKNLRGLINFINNFYKLEYIKTETLKDKNKQFKKNIEKFDDYFFHSWIDENLIEENKNIIKELHTKVVGEKNKYIVTKILEKAEEKEYIKLNTVNKYKFISTNISLGDVLEVLGDLKKLKVDNDNENFIDAVKILYSRYIYEYYLDYRLKKESGEIEKEEYSDYEMLIGGELFLSKNILYSPEKFESFDPTLFYNKLKDIFRKYDNDILENIEKFENLQPKEKENLKTELKEIEFLVFLTYFFKDVHSLSKRLNSDKRDNKKLGRVRDEAFYDGICDLNTKIITNFEFDIFSPLFFSLSEYRLLKRYKSNDKNLYDVVKEINKKIEEKKTNELEKIDINLFEGIYFRNIEIIEKIFLRIVQRTKKEITKLEVIKFVYEDLAKIKIEEEIIKEGKISHSKNFEKVLKYLGKEETKRLFYTYEREEFISKIAPKLKGPLIKLERKLKSSRHRLLKNFKNDFLNYLNNDTTNPARSLFMNFITNNKADNLKELKEDMKKQIENLRKKYGVKDD
ncbi:hypothetical protein [Fusobacterium sp.]|uniref:hypothetical protein n=1 Tax=Fusobacterium sp. TaxID=68766 RepID=UPI00262BBA80|nr:hypothetical protein [Fusobacterium sp.]